MIQNMIMPKLEGCDWYLKDRNILLICYVGEQALLREKLESWLII